MRTEDLDQTDLERRDLAMPTCTSATIDTEPRITTKRLHEDTSQIQLYLETNVDVCSIDRRTPPESESPIGDLVQTGTLGIRKLLVSHRFFETGRFLPEKTLPSREVSTLEESVLQDTLNTS